MQLKNEFKRCVYCHNYVFNTESTLRATIALNSHTLFQYIWKKSIKEYIYIYRERGKVLWMIIIEVKWKKSIKEKTPFGWSRRIYSTIQTKRTHIGT